MLALVIERRPHRPCFLSSAQRCRCQCLHEGIFILFLSCFKVCKCKTFIFIHKQNGNTALAFASFEGHLEVVSELVKYGANVNFRLNVCLLKHPELESFIEITFVAFRRRVSVLFIWLARKDTQRLSSSLFKMEPTLIFPSRC